MSHRSACNDGAGAVPLPPLMALLVLLFASPFVYDFLVRLASTLP